MDYVKLFLDHQNKISKKSRTVLCHFLLNYVFLIHEKFFEMLIFIKKN